MKRTDLTALTVCAAEQLSELVQSCSFKHKRWEEVAAHPFFDDPLQEIDVSASYFVLEDTEASKKTKIESRPKDADLISAAPLQESIIVEET